MPDYQEKKDMLVQIVSVYAARPDVTAEDIAALAEKLSRVFAVEEDADTVAANGVNGVNGIDATAVQPASDVVRAVSIEKAVTRDKVYCMCCGKGFKMLKRHIGAEHGLSEAQYRAKFGLPDDFPLVAPSYSEMKASYAKKAGLGKYARQAADPVE
jgi:predicted transcriptional regulator